MNFDRIWILYNPIYVEARHIGYHIYESLHKLFLVGIYSQVMRKNCGELGHVTSNQKNMINNRMIRGMLIVSGTFFVVIGIIGIFLPILPTTPFLLLAAWCYAKSSKTFYNWLISNKLFGNYIKNYREGRGIPLKVKIISISFLWITILFSAAFIVTNLFVRIILILIAIGVTIHIRSIRTLK